MMVGDDPCRHLHMPLMRQFAQILSRVPLQGTRIQRNGTIGHLADTLNNASDSEGTAGPEGVGSVLSSQFIGSQIVMGPSGSDMPVDNVVDCDPRSWEARAFLVRKVPDSCIEGCRQRYCR